MACCDDKIVSGKQAKFDGSELVLVNGSKTLATFCLCTFNKDFTDSKILEFELSPNSIKSVIDIMNEDFSFMATSVSYLETDNNIFYQESFYERDTNTNDVTIINDISHEETWSNFNKLLIKDMSNDFGLTKLKFFNPNDNIVTIKIILLK